MLKITKRGIRFVRTDGYTKGLASRKYLLKKRNLKINMIKKSCRPIWLHEDSIKYTY